MNRRQPRIALRPWRADMSDTIASLSTNHTRKVPQQQNALPHFTALDLSIRNAERTTWNDGIAIGNRVREFNIHYCSRDIMILSFI